MVALACMGFILCEADGSALHFIVGDNILAACVEGHMTGT